MALQRTAAEVVKNLNEEFGGADAIETLKWSLEHFGERVAFASSLGAEDMVITDLLWKVDPKSRIFTLDTGRLPEETYRVMDKVREKYGINLEVYFPENDRVEEMVRSNGINLFYDSVEYRKLCCYVRKMEPLKRALSELDAWICGLRRDQSVTREDLAVFELDETNGGILKVNPLIDWSEEDVWKYIRENNIPYNELHDKNYPSIGCEPCTRAIRTGEDVRAGRWWWESPEQKECGLHAK
ncbi:MAG: phosphoadenylyl-sulfate reductase [Deltaproteobacteria bacterium]|nr:phosphoadenylyl-sulfate reductase [Deltaproteobacteria bacterium]NIS77210.1 phosphoadenylyl-sulfate reductase [Deltaproteobacteria bacterium]